MQVRWAVKRQVEYALGIFLALVLVSGGGWYLFVYQPASCTDNIQDQQELGIDCDGPCATICKPPRVDALWARPVKAADGVYHAVSLVKNPLTDARGSNLNYTLSLYDEGNILIAERRGTFDLTPGETRSIFEAGIITGSRIPVRAFITIGGGVWTKATATPSPIKTFPGTVDQTALVFPGTLTNTTAVAVNNIVADALLYDANDILITASETKIGTIPARGSQDITYTWNVPFSAPVVRADIQVRVEHATTP
jgi:hypothetical protein